MTQGGLSKSFICMQENFGLIFPSLVKGCMGSERNDCEACFIWEGGSGGVQSTGA